MRLVLDTNIVVSYALRPVSPLATLVDGVLLRHRLLLSADVVEEFRRTLSKPKFSSVLTPEDIHRLVTSFAAAGEMVSTMPRIQACRDSDDDKFLELAVGGKCRRRCNWRQRSIGLASVSGDRDRLSWRHRSADLTGAAQ